MKMHSLGFNYKMRSLFCNIILVTVIGSVMMSCSQMKMTTHQFHNIEIEYPENWSVEDSGESILIQPNEENDAGITILSNPPEYLKASLKQSLEDFLSSEILPNFKEVLTSSPVQGSEFNGYTAVQGQVVADLARSEGATYALQVDLILVEYENERALIIVHQRGGIETINSSLAEDMENIIRSFRFRAD